jgi:prevent-host-death family protein
MTSTIDSGAADHYSDHMGKTVTATEAKAKILALLDEVESGEEIEITRHGRLIARLVPVRGGAALRGRYAGLGRTAVDDEELLKPIDEEWSADDWLDPDEKAPL